MGQSQKLSSNSSGCKEICVGVPKSMISVLHKEEAKFPVNNIYALILAKDAAFRSELGLD